MSESKAARPPDASVMFDRREKGDAKVNVSQTVAINSPMSPQAVAPGPAGPSSLPVAGGPTAVQTGGSSSLDFVKGGANNQYFQDNKPAVPPAQSTEPVTPPAAAPPVEAPKPAPVKKGGKKPFFMPKLQGTKSLGSFKGGSPKAIGAPKGMTGVADPQAGGGGDMGDLLKNVPGGASNPEVQKYLKSQGK